MVAELERSGYKFWTEYTGKAVPHTPLTHSPERAKCLVDWMDDTFGGIGLLAKTFILTVGDVNLVGSCEEWELNIRSVDPFVMEFQGNNVTESVEDVKGFYSSCYEGLNHPGYSREFIG